MNTLQVKLQKIALQITKRIRKVHPEVHRVNFEARHASYGSNNQVVVWDKDNNIIAMHSLFKTDNPRVMADFMIREINTLKKHASPDTSDFIEETF